MRILALALTLACISIIASGASAYAVSFNCVPYFKTGPPIPSVVSNVTEIPNATQEEWWLVECKAIPITVATDKLSYENGDTITATGTVSKIPPGMIMSVKVVSPNGNLVKVDQTTVGPDGTFSDKLVTGGVLWQQAGIYKLEVMEINTQQSATAEFYFAGPPAKPYSSTILVTNTNTTVPYTIVNGMVNSVTVDAYMRSLIISIQATGKGALTIDLPRALIDSKGANQTDLDFVVTTNGKAPSFDETRGPVSRDLVIPFDANATSIRIIGTQVVPEFGALAGLVMAAMIASALAVGASRLGKLGFRK